MGERRVKVAVLMGGRSGEHDVSLASGRATLAHLPADRFEAFGVLLGRDGRWRFGEEAHAAGSGAGLELPEGLRALLDRGPDVAFLAMHGPEGEDGKMQSLFELVGLPYTGSDAYASSLAMNKPAAKRVFVAHGIPVASDVVVHRSRWDADREAALAWVRERFAPPWVCKTPKLGSSVGLDIVPTPDRLEGTLETLFGVDDEVMIEEFVAGREFTCAVLDGASLGPTRALPLVEISPIGEPFFNYRAKYTPGVAREICPAPLAPEPTRRIQELGLRAHRALSCRGFSRTDFILRADGSLVTLETNTIPGLTETSLLPQAAAADGLSFAALVAGMAASALAHLPASLARRRPAP